jgi:hypothetical protein
MLADDLAVTGIMMLMNEAVVEGFKEGMSRERAQKTTAADWSEEELATARESIDLLKEALENFPSQSAGVDLA